MNEELLHNTKDWIVHHVARGENVKAIKYLNYMVDEVEILLDEYKKQRRKLDIIENAIDDLREVK